MGANAQLPRVGSAVIVTDGDGVLLGVRAKEPNKGKWVLPGGKVEPFESIEEAAKREVREETGLDVRIVRQLGTYEIINPPEEHRLIVFSHAERVSGVPTAGDDIAEVRFWTKADLIDLPISPFVADVLAQHGWIADHARAA